jgi:hypothetical protein
MSRFLLALLLATSAGHVIGAQAISDVSPPVRVGKGAPGNDAVQTLQFTISARAQNIRVTCHRKWEGDTAEFGSANVVDCNNVDFGWGRFTGVSITKTVAGTTFTTTCRNWSKQQERLCTLKVDYEIPD